MWWEDDASGAGSAEINVLQGLPIFDATTGQSQLRSRLSGSGQFTLVNFNATRLQNLGDGFQLYAAAMAQVATRGLLTAEQCGYGGKTFGQGFDSSEIVGDNCVEGSVELRYNPATGLLRHVQFYAFADAGGAWLDGKLLTGETLYSSSQSAGVGLRIDLTHGFGATVEFAQPFSRDVALEGNRNGRVFFSISKGF